MPSFIWQIHSVGVFMFFIFGVVEAIVLKYDAEILYNTFVLSLSIFDRDDALRFITPHLPTRKN